MKAANCACHVFTGMHELYNCMPFRTPGMLTHLPIHIKEFACLYLGRNSDPLTFLWTLNCKTIAVGIRPTVVLLILYMYSLGLPTKFVKHMILVLPIMTDLSISVFYCGLHSTTLSVSVGAA